ncbi:hypothetical protein T492DRAFT_1019252, partial [Pavlovales sp. CCMP2436]
MGEQNLVLGTAVAYAMFVVLQGLILLTNFTTDFTKPGNKLPDPNPVVYLRAALQSFVAMILTGGVVTVAYSGIVWDETVLMKWYGYNNICVVFDDPPASYICPVYWVAVAYFAGRYCIADTARVYRLTSVGSGLRAAVYAVNTAFALVALFFAVCLGIGPGENMYLHTAPFMCLVLVLPLVHLLQVAQGKKPIWYMTLSVLFFITSVTKFFFTGYALANPGQPLASGPARMIDAAWVLLALSSSFLMPLPPQAGIKKQNEVTVASAELRVMLMLPLALVLLVTVPLALVYHLLAALVLRTLAACGLVGKAPDATPGYGMPLVPGGYSKLPMTAAFIGDILGYLPFMKSAWHLAYASSKELSTGIYCANYGRPFVVLTSALFGGSESFMGLENAKILKFHQKICSKKPDGPEMAAGIKALRVELATWANMSWSNNLGESTMDELMIRASCAFTSAFLLGAPIDTDIIHELYPVPANLPLYPWLPVPSIFLPWWGKGRVIATQLYKQMRKLPKWQEVAELAAEAGYDETMALGDVLQIITLNANGLANPFINGLAVLQLMTPAELNALRNSLAWDLDPSVYPEPYVFDPTRFATADPYLSRPTWSKQPLPTMGQGLKFGGLADDKACSAKCVCPFVKLTQPLICAFIEMLLFDFDFVLANFGRNDAAANDEESVVPRSRYCLLNFIFFFFFLE